jgi:hypothetical protein
MRMEFTHMSVDALVAVLVLTLGPGIAAFADDQPASAAPSVSEQAKAVGETVKQDAKAVAGAATEGAKQVAVAWHTRSASRPRRVHNRWPWLRRKPRRRPRPR